MPKHHCAIMRSLATDVSYDAEGSAALRPASAFQPMPSGQVLLFDRPSDTEPTGYSPCVTSKAGTLSVQQLLEPLLNAEGNGDAVDRALMLRIIGRDKKAFAILAERHATTSLGIAQRVVRNMADAEDVVQESLTRLWIFADRWNPNTARFTSWFYRIVTNQAISRLRRKATDSIDSVDEPADASPGPHERMAGREIGAAIERAIMRLPARQRAAIALCYDQGLTCAEAADAMNVSVGTMESLLFRARRSLREWLGPLNAELEEL